MKRNIQGTLDRRWRRQNDTRREREQDKVLASVAEMSESHRRAARMVLPLFDGTAARQTKGE